MREGEKEGVREWKRRGGREEGEGEVCDGKASLRQRRLQATVRNLDRSPDSIPLLLLQQL